jgi:hypothetical protein
MVFPSTYSHDLFLIGLEALQFFKALAYIILYYHEVFFALAVFKAQS